MLLMLPVLVCVCVCFSLGVLIAYAANHNISTHIKSTRRLINTNMRDLRTFANNTPEVSTDSNSHTPNTHTQLIVLLLTLLCVFLLQQIEYLTAQYTTAKNKVLSDLDSKFITQTVYTLLDVTRCIYNECIVAMTRSDPSVSPDRHRAVAGWQDPQSVGERGGAITGHCAAHGWR